MPVDTHCPYCALQCGVREFPANRGGLCQKGWTAAAPLDSPGRLTVPLVRTGGELRQGNGQGGREHGQKADQLPGYRRVDDPAARAHVAGRRAGHRLAGGAGAAGGPTWCCRRPRDAPTWCCR